MTNKNYYITTFGCQMNAHDSEKLSGMLDRLGYTKVESEDFADLIIYNTCCIRESAENRVFGNLGYLKFVKEKRPNLKVAVCGCMPQQKDTLEKLKSKYKHVDIIFGTHNLHMLGELLEKAEKTKGQLVDVWEGKTNLPPENDELYTVRERPYRSGINIMYGCNNYCSYCVVPYVRGPERSRFLKDIMKEAESLINDGVKEIMLLGQNVNSYNGDGLSFSELLHKLSEMSPKIERIRFMTSHPKDLSKELVYAIRDLDCVCKHIHLPVQSGSTKILEKMNRKYTRESYLNLVKLLREEIPGIAITTDIIVGFPSETEEDFLETISLVEEVRYNGAYTFLYSKRGGTPAAEMNDQIPLGESMKRFQRLIKTLNPIIGDINKGYEGKTFKLLAEKLEHGVYTGRADNNSIVHFKAENNSKNILGQIVDVNITEGKPFYLMGKLSEQGEV